MWGFFQRIFGRKPSEIEPAAITTYSFRLRVIRANGSTLNFDETKVDFSVEDSGISIALHSSSPGKSIKEAEQWALVGNGYGSEEDAKNAGAYFRDVLMLCLAKSRVGVDFGDRAPKGFVTPYGIKKLEDEVGSRVLNDVHGLMTYVTEPKPKFYRFQVGATRGANTTSFHEAWRTALALKPQLSESEGLAISLFNSSFFQPSGDSRFLLLVMAIEAMISPNPKSAEAVQYVDRFIAEIDASPLKQKEKTSLTGSLRWLRDESISQAGKTLVESRLGNRTYGNRTASKFFSDVYSLRSRLVHGSSFPTVDEIADTVGVLEVFVSDLLCEPLQMPQDSDLKFVSRLDARL